ncbi:MAG: hypothetical protein QOE14_1736 [Humisphaera sp.]|nr:hypothetical protein [Humisphaera sp.]
MTVRITQGVDMTDGRRMLLETLAGHFALLKSAHPRKAASATAKKAQRYIARSLREMPRKRAA